MKRSKIDARITLTAVKIALIGVKTFVIAEKIAAIREKIFVTAGKIDGKMRVIEEVIVAKHVQTNVNHKGPIAVTMVTAERAVAIALEEVPPAIINASYMHKNKLLTKRS